MTVFSKQPECLKNLPKGKNFKKSIYGKSGPNKTNTKSISNLDNISTKSPSNDANHLKQSKKSVDGNIIDFFTAKQDAMQKPQNYYLLQMKPKRKIQYFNESVNNNPEEEECMSINIFQKGTLLSQY